VVGAGGHTTAATTLKKEEVLEMVQKQIGLIIAFKQAQLDYKKQKVREMIDKEANAAAATGEGEKQESAE